MPGEELVADASTGLPPLLAQLLSTLATEMTLPRAFVHASAILGLSGCLSSNILVLRTLSVLSSTMALCFNVWNRLRSPIIWNLTFMTTNLSHIARLLLKDKGHITITTDEQQLFELAFARYGVRLTEFLHLLKGESDLAAAHVSLTAKRTLACATSHVPMRPLPPLLQRLVRSGSSIRRTA